MDADEALARALQAEEHAAAAAAAPASAPRDNRAEFASRLQGGMATALRHAARPLQAQARAVMPLQQARLLLALSAHALLACRVASSSRSTFACRSCVRRPRPRCWRQRPTPG
jgi:hypothetical protein